MLEEFIEANKLKAKIVHCKKEVHSSKAAAAVLGKELSDIAKTIVLIDVVKEEAVLVVLLGNSTADLEKIKKITGLKELELASPEQTLELTGYETGGVPPISIYGAKTIVDKKVMEKETVFAGGGDNFSILEISPKEIEEFGFEVQIKDICA